MKKEDFDNSSEIYLFRMYRPNGADSSTKLNEFINYLKFNRVAAPFQFSYVSTKGDLISELTLNQNILLEYTSPSLTEEKEGHLRKFFKERPNLHLEALYNMISNIDEYPSEAGPEENKITALLKAFIANKPFIFLEYPEAELSPKAQKLLQKAIELQAKNLRQNIFIVTKQEQNWSKYISKIVERTESFSFKTKNAEYLQEFKLEKEKFYLPVRKEAANLPILSFKIPKKKSAA